MKPKLKTRKSTKAGTLKPVKTQRKRIKLKKRLKKRTRARGVGGNRRKVD